MTETPKIVKDREDFRRGESPQSIWPLLWDLESKYGYSARRLYEHARHKSPRILGVGLVNGSLVIQGDPWNFVGPVPAESCDFLKPKWAQACRVELFTSSPISSAIWLYPTLDKKAVVLRADISGAWVQLYFI